MAAIEQQDWGRLKRLSHPYIHWKDHQVELRGRRKVLAHLVDDPVIHEPTSYELRDGQVYRWTIDQGS